MRRRFSLFLLVVLCAAAPTVAAHSPVRLDVVDRDTGLRLPQHPHRGDTWIAGTPGHRYGIRLTNTTGSRVLVVLSVDGVNAVTGETADPGQEGYVLAPWQSTEIVGWRKSLDAVAAFVFSRPPDSYAARTGRPDDVGVLGIAVFHERMPARPLPSPQLAKDAASAASPARDAEAAAGAQPADTARQRLGTGHGAQEHAPIGRTRFVRAGARPAQVVQLRYDTPQALAVRGILPRPARDGWRPRSPQAFPGGFVPDPPARGRYRD